MPAKPVASQVCNVAPCNHTCRCDDYNFWACKPVEANSSDSGIAERHLILLVNGQETIVNVLDYHEPLHVCMYKYPDENEAFRHPCPSGNGWCYYWQDDDFCGDYGSYSEPVYRQPYCVKRID